jgi:hypothetical protein
MPDWLHKALGAEVSGEDSLVLVARLAISLALGALVVAVYRGTRSATNVTPSFPATLVLLTVLIAMITQVIGDNVARAFSLVGALSIVRFRTVVRDTKDTAFVIFAVGVGMAVGAGQPHVAVLGLTAVSVAAVLFRDRPPAAGVISGAMELSVRCGWTADLEAKLLAALAPHALGVEELSVGTVRGGSALDLAYRVRLLPGVSATRVVMELQRLEGVQSVELRKGDEPA